MYSKLDLGEYLSSNPILENNGCIRRVSVISHQLELFDPYHRGAHTYLLPVYRAPSPFLSHQCSRDDLLAPQGMQPFSGNIR